MGEVEAALAAVERDADRSLQATASVLRELKKTKKAAVDGNLRDLRKSMEAAEQLAAQLASAARALRAGWNIDEQDLLASGRYTKELETARSEGVDVLEQDDRLLCYPSVIRVSASDAAVEIDKKKHRTLRPSVLVEQLKKAQRQPPKFKPEALLEALAAAYDLVVAREAKAPDATVRVTDVYDVLTLMPGTARDYTKQDFARDLYLLDQSGTSRTKGGRELRLPASTLTKGAGLLTTVTKSGQQKVYAGISFS
jgi:hypothetical protein